jgi:transcriptional regulator with XRE-family HTH domain
MGTETHRLQSEIKRLIKRLGWSQKRLARELQAMEEDGAWASTHEVSQYEERVKKHLTRPTVSTELLERYLQQIQAHQDFAKLDIFIPHAQIDEEFSEEFVQGMRRISAMLDEKNPEGGKT